MNDQGRLTVPEFAAELKLKPRTVRAWIRLRKIDHYRVGGRVLIPGRELTRLLKAGLIPRSEVWA